MSNAFRIPFVDYARGDGISIGPGQVRVWSPVSIGPPPAWVSGFRGLWGFYARDPATGQTPRLDRCTTATAACDEPGTTRWGGPGSTACRPRPTKASIRERIAEIDAHTIALDEAIATGTSELRALHLELAASRNQPHLNGHLPASEARLRAVRAEIDGHRREQNREASIRDALAARLDRLAEQSPDAVTMPDERLAHAQHVAHPATAADLRLRRLLGCGRPQASGWCCWGWSRWRSARANISSTARR